MYPNTIASCIYNTFHFTFIIILGMELKTFSTAIVSVNVPPVIIISGNKTWSFCNKVFVTKLDVFVTKLDIFVTKLEVSVTKLEVSLTKLNVCVIKFQVSLIIPLSFNICSFHVVLVSMYRSLNFNTTCSSLCLYNSDIKNLNIYWSSNNVDNYSKGSPLIT